MPARLSRPVSFLQLSLRRPWTVLVLVLARRALAAAAETEHLTRARKEFGVGVVLESIQAQQDLTRAREAYLSAVAEAAKAQYALLRAVGGIGP